MSLNVFVRVCLIEWGERLCFGSVNIMIKIDKIFVFSGKILGF